MQYLVATIENETESGQVNSASANAKRQNNVLAVDVTGVRFQHFISLVIPEPDRRIQS